MARKEYEKKFDVDLKFYNDAKAQIKRLGVYYMCIDDLPL
jgi:hypothetical protein